VPVVKAKSGGTYHCFYCGAIVEEKDGRCRSCGMEFHGIIESNAGPARETEEVPTTGRRARQAIAKVAIVVFAAFMFYLGGSMALSALKIVLAATGVIVAGERDASRLVGGAFWAILLGVGGLVLISLTIMGAVLLWPSRIKGKDWT
jgi:hypothetical protein